MSLGECCKTGVVHEGESKGSIETIDGIKVYVAKPSGEYDNTKAVVMLTDVFGIELVNSRLLADSFAANGYQTYIPDLFNSEAVPVDGMQPGSSFTWDKFNVWIGKHMPDTAKPVVDKFLAKLEADGVLFVGAVGYCYGVKLGFWAAFEHKVKVLVGCHPSFVEVPGDLHKIKESGVPLLINSCEHDPRFPPEAQKQADEILGGSSTYKREYFPGCSHGFAVRGDLSDPKVKAGKEGAFKATVEWFNAHL
ncbi:hypothetical protein EMMF5_004025 [Cystobasidiomycetes sp. EMM_F5]